MRTAGIVVLSLATLLLAGLAVAIPYVIWATFHYGVHDERIRGWNLIVIAVEALVILLATVAKRMIAR